MESFREKIMSSKRLKMFFKYTLIFLIVPAIGTLLHEFGHYIVAIINGYEAYIAYAYTIYTINDPIVAFWALSGGPLATWFQSLTAFTIMVLYYNKEKRGTFTEDLPPLYIVLLATFSFSIRFIFNAIGYLLRGSTTMDEVRIGLYLGIHPDVVVYGSALIAVVFLVIAIYRIPKSYRFMLFFSAVFGAILGYLMWYEWLGPILLPVY